MANFDKPNGLHILSPDAQAHPYTTSAIVTAGDLLAMVSGAVLPYVEVTHTAAIGVAATSAASGAEVLVFDGDYEFWMQTSGTYTATSDDGTRCDIEGATGVQEANEDATVNSTLLIVRQYLGIDGATTDASANARVVVRIAKHARVNLTGALTASTITATGAVECDSTLGVDGDFRIGAAGASKFDVDSATGDTQCDGTMEVDGTLGVDGAFRVGAAGASKFDVDETTGDTQVDGTLEVDGTLGVDGAFRVGAAGASKFDVDETNGNTQIDGTLGVDGIATFGAMLKLAAGANTETLAAGKTLTTADAQFQRLDPDGAGRDVTLPAHADGIWFLIYNAADAAENLTIKDSAAAGQAVLNQNEAGIFVSLSSTWHSFGLTGVVDISA